MNKLFTIVGVVLFTAGVFLPQQADAQPPEKMSYQAVLRNADNALLTSTVVGMQISILISTADGTAVYVETQTPITNANGLVSLEIGTGTSTDDFSSIDWSAGPYFIKTETDPEGGINYAITGTSQLLSVPYALYAKTAESITGTITEDDPVYISSEAANITATDINNLGYLSGTNTGDQDLSGLAAQTALEDSASAIRSAISDVSGFISIETDPVFGASVAANITSGDITHLGNLSGTNTGDQNLTGLATQTALKDTASAIRSAIPDVSGFLTSETDPFYATSEAINIDANDITNLGNLSGINTGNQDLSGLAAQTALEDTASAIRSAIPDVSGFLSIETDPFYAASEAINIDANDITNLGNLSGINTGNQDLSGLAAQTALEDTASAIRSAIPDVSGFLTSETDPVYGSSVAAGITGTDTINWNNDLVDDADADTTNELQNFEQVLIKGNDANGISIVNTGKIGVGTASPSAESSMEIAIALPVIFPSMTQSEVNAIFSPVEGMVQFNTDAHKLQVYAMLTDNASILNEIFMNNSSGPFNPILNQSCTSPIDGQVVAIEIMYKDFDLAIPDIDLDVNGVFQGIQMMPSYTQFTWHTFTLETPAPVTAGVPFNFNFMGPGADFHEFATNSNYPNGSGGCCFDSGDDDLLFRVHIQPDPGSYGWQNMH